MMGEDGMWSGYMINYNLGNDLHRTPFGGRNFEYMSECPILNYLAGAVEVEAMEKTGSHAGPSTLSATTRNSTAKVLSASSMNRRSARAT